MVKLGAVSKRQKPNWLGGLFGWIWLAIIIVPIYYIVITSLRPREDYFSANPLSLPTEWSLESYSLVLQNDFFRYFANSLIVTLVTVVVTVGFSVMAAYVVVRRRTKFSQYLNRAVLLGIAIPIQACIVPVYYMIVKMGLYDSLIALILPSIAFAIPITMMILINFMRDIPNELFESMVLDGASDMVMLREMVLPLTKPALVTVGIYDALNCWNGFLFPLILTQSSSVRVLPLSLWSYQGEFTINVPAVLAAVTLSVLPIFLLYIFGRRQLVSGLTAGFSK